MRFRYHARCGHVLSCIAVLLSAARASAQEPPRFRSSVEVLSVDVAVIDGSGQPILGLQPADFSVRVDDEARRVVSAEWVPLGLSEATAPPELPQGYSSNEMAAAGRLIVLAIDQPNIRFGGTAMLRRSIGDFLDQLHPSDRVAVVGIGLGAISTPFSSDREQAKAAVIRMTGQRQMLDDARFTVAISEAMQIYEGQPVVTQAVVTRECGTLNGLQLDDCVLGVRNVSTMIAQEAEENARRTLSTLRSILTSLRLIDAPKTLVFFSEGFVLSRELNTVTGLGTLAGLARTTIFALKLDHEGADATVAMPSPAPFDDRRLMTEGLAALAGAARGSIFDISPGAAGALKRIQSETSGYYLLGLEADPVHSGARSHAIRVEVARRGATVRWRREVVGLGGRTPAENPRQAVLDALRAPLMVSGLPLRVITFSLRDPDPSKIQLLVHAEVGADYSSSRPVQIGYTIVDGEGRAVESQSGAARLGPVMDGVPSPLQFKTGASVPAGTYTLKLAVAEGDRVGSVEHTIDARLIDAGSIELSELMVGGPAVGQDGLQPSIGHAVSFGVLHGYLEAYGRGSDSLKMKYEVARSADAPAVLTAQVAGRRVSAERTIFTHMLPIRQLPSGKYLLRATLASGDAAKPIKTLVREFEVTPPPVLMASAEAGGAVVASPTELFLPVHDGLLARAFDKADAARPEVLDPFRARVHQDAREAFDRGVAAFSAGDFGKAEASFKAAIQPDAETTAPVAYLAATFAAVGRDDEAAGAWQTALIDGSDLPQIYVWLGDTLMRRRSLVQARAILEEAVAAWPTDVRFAKPLALLYATFGLGREAVRTMERHLDHDPADAESLALAVEWIYLLHSAGAVAHTRAEDLKLAHGYAAAYEQMNGPSLPLVQEWLGALESGRR